MLKAVQLISIRDFSQYSDAINVNIMTLFLINKTVNC